MGSAAKRPQAKKPAASAPNPDAFLTQGQADAMLAANAAASIANPAEVRRAMLAVPRRVRGVAIRVVTLGDYILLEEMKSPLIEGVREPSFFDVAAAAYVLSHEPEPTAELWQEGKGASAFRAAVAKFARRFAPADLAELTSAVTAALFIGFDPEGEGAARDDDSKKKRRSPTGGR